MRLLKKIWKANGLPVLAGLAFWCFFHSVSGQQVKWAKLYTLPSFDYITCITQDSFGDMYAGGYSNYGAQVPGNYPRAMIYKLNPDGDTIFSMWTGYYGFVQSMVHNPEGYINVALMKRGPSQLILLRMTYEGFIFRRDTIPKILYVNHSCIGKDSSWILCGTTSNVFNGFLDDVYVQRIQKDGTIEPYFALNDNFSGQAHRVEQLPNGKYLVSGSAGLLLFSYTFEEDLTNPQPMELWYQGVGNNPITNGVVSRISANRYLVAGESGPCFVGQFDSLKQKYWIHKQVGTQIPPQAMTDGSVVFGYLTSIGPPNPFYRLGPDSSTIWYISIKDSLIARGINNAVDLKCFTYFEDQSAVIAGVVQNPSTSRDPIFLKISNLGTPVTSLSKPKKGPLQNETLAPWPNPSDGTLYLKQHFDKAEIHLYQLSGQEVAQYQIRFGQPIQIHQLPAGLYLYRAVIDGKAFSGKIMKAAP